MFISEAYAAAAPVALEANSLNATLIQLALILLIFYFLLVRPQQKRIKEHNDMVEALKIGDRVLTNGGIYGRVAKINGLELSLEVAPNVEIVIDRMSVSSVVEATEKAETKNKSEKKSKKK